MQADLVPVWVAVAAVGVIIGVIVGLLIGSRHANRRWSREAQREEQRWARELHREQQRWTREGALETARFQQHARLEWRSQRLDSYAGYLRTVDDFMQEFGLVYLLFFEPEAPRPNDSHGEEIGAIKAASLPIEFIASASVRQAAEALRDACIKLNHAARPFWTDNMKRPALDKAAVERCIAEVSGCRAGFTNAVRVELAADFDQS